MTNDLSLILHRIKQLGYTQTQYVYVEQGNWIMSNSTIHVETQQPQGLFNINIQQLFEFQVKQTPTATAVICGNAQLTYQELNTKANRLASILQAQGVGPEVLVGIYVERSLDMIVALLATIKAGGAFVPLDPTHPQERLAFILNDSQVAVLLTQERLLGRLPEHNARVVCIDIDEKMRDAKAQDVNPPCIVSAENAAYVIYTSGSTGQPKGVIILQGAIAQHVLTIQKHFQLTASDRVLQFSTFTFDTAIEQILSPLITGATLVLRGPEVWTSTEMYEEIAEFRLSIVNLPTAYWQQMVYDWVNESREILNSTLRLVAIGGDRLLPQYLELWEKLPKHAVRLINAYGPTETTITATMFDIPSLEERAGVPFENVPIGHALGARTLYVLDTDGKPVVSGEAGELYIGGPLLARGYLHRPQLTAERFIHDSFSQDEHTRMYKTGDLVRELADGTLEFIGRIDYQVKIRGFRVELGEIEAALKYYPGIRETIVVARENTTGSKVLAAYVIPEHKQTPDSKQIRAFLKQKLPEYMVPSTFTILDAFPLTPNGKIDRHALPAPEMDRQVEEVNFVAPSHPLHRQLVQLWEELLDIRPIGITDDFFELGGHSMLAIRLFSRIEQVFGQKLPLATFYMAATIEHLANVLQQNELHEATTEALWRTPIETFQAIGSKRPFFYLHGDWTSTAFYCARMVPELGPDQPFYALTPYRFDGQRVPPSFTEMVQAHLDVMRSIQPEGPYLLGGFCNGAHVAYEMARILQEQGKKVDLLALINFSHTPKRTMLIHKLFRGVSGLLGINEEKQIDLFLHLRHLYKHFQPSRQQKIQDFEHLNRIDKRFKRFFPPKDILRLDYVGMFTWVAVNYVPSGYRGKLTVFWDSEDDSIQEAGFDLVGGAELEKHILPGNHTTCRTKHYHELGQLLRISFDKVQ